MNSYEIAVTDGQARSLALEVAAQEPSRIYMIKLIEAALANIHSHSIGLDSLNSVLNRQGFNVTVIPVADKPVRAYAEPIKKHKNSTVGSQVRLLRKARDWSQTELAERLGCKQTVISLMERGTKPPSEDIIKRLAEVFAVDVAAISAAPADDTPMTEKKYLGREHPVVDRTKPRTSKKPTSAQRFDEEGEDDDLPTARELQRGKTYDPVEVTGPKVLDIITFRSISLETLRDSFEVTPEEYERIRSQHWADFGARSMHELLVALESEYKNAGHPAFDTEHTLKEPKPLREKPPAQLTRSQLVAELRQHMLEQSWLTKDELIANFEFGEEEVDWLNANDHTKFNVTELRTFVTDVRGAIAERAIEVQTKEVPPLAVSGTKISKLIKAFELTYDRLRPLDISRNEYEELKLRYYDSFTAGQLVNLLEGVELLALQPTPEPNEYICERLLIDVVFLEELFDVTPEIYAEAGVGEDEQHWIKDRDSSYFAGKELTKIREGLKVVLRRRYTEAK